MTAKKQRGSYQDFVEGDIYNREFIFRIINQVPNTTMTDSFGRPVHNGNERIEAFSVIREKDINGKIVQRSIRLALGETSIYVDEQSNDKDIPKKKVMLEFPRGLKRVDGEDVLLLKYMMKDNLNRTNPGRRKDIDPMYELVDISQKIEAEMEDDHLLDEARNFAWKGEWEDVEAYARVLNVNMVQSPKEIRYELRGIASLNPKKFLDGLKDPAMKRKHYVLKAIDEGFLVLNPQNNSIAWKTNPNQPLDVAPVGKDVVDSFVRKLSTDEGKLHYEAIIDAVSPAIAPEPMKAAVPTQEEIDSMKAESKATAALSICEESDEQLSEMIKQAIKAGVVTTKPPFWYDFRGEKYKKEEGLITALKSDAYLLKVFKVELSRTRDTL